MKSFFKRTQGYEALPSNTTENSLTEIAFEIGSDDDDSDTVQLIAPPSR
jgi:hypothetical protein